MIDLFKPSDYECIEFNNTLHPRITVRPMYYELGFSPVKILYGRRVILERLIAALSLLPKSYGFLIWDVYRSRAVQAKLFDWMRSEIQKENPEFSETELLEETRKYCSLPSKPGEVYCPPHLSGGAIDLTLYDLETETVLDLGSAFDECHDRSRSDYFEIHTPKDQQEKLFRARRRHLSQALQAQGFTPYIHEWWHFDLGDCFWSRVTGKPAVFGPLFGDEEWPEQTEAQISYND